jgi:hypothetical protein
MVVCASRVGQGRCQRYWCTARPPKCRGAGPAHRSPDLQGCYWWLVRALHGHVRQILPKHALQDYVCAGARNAPFNLKAFGVGPFLVQDFRPRDLITLTANSCYREPGKPFFKTVQIKGGGDATSAPRAV